MNETIIKFCDVNIDGNGTDVCVIARVYGKEVPFDTVERIKDAIFGYKEENEGEWDTDGCLDVAKKLLESEGYEVHFINPSIEICF